MDTKEQLETVVFHQTQCITALDEMKKLIATHHEDHAINKLKDIEKELVRLTMQLKEIEEQV